MPAGPSVWSHASITVSIVSVSWLLSLDEHTEGGQEVNGTDEYGVDTVDNSDLLDVAEAGLGLTSTKDPNS